MYLKTTVLHALSYNMLIGKVENSMSPKFLGLQVMKNVTNLEETRLCLSTKEDLSRRELKSGWLSPADLLFLLPYNQL